MHFFCIFLRKNLQKAICSSYLCIVIQKQHPFTTQSRLNHESITYTKSINYENHPKPQMPINHRNHRPTPRLLYPANTKRFLHQKEQTPPTTTAHTLATNTNTRTTRLPQYTHTRHRSVTIRTHPRTLPC